MFTGTVSMILLIFMIGLGLQGRVRGKSKELILKSPQDYIKLRLQYLKDLKRLLIKVLKVLKKRQPKVEKLLPRLLLREVMQPKKL
ncbi:hypothetical protein [Desulfovibrio gilichinskyi]|uniref:hypothetical protein n=1 Tax=Desulfovibrio gilichinskyi TaxID=1519643 RepID=UPI000A15D474|nr:hypothetical protein [Desulfovibrio gilichinskyi]